MECLACYTPNIDGASFCAKCGAPLPKANTAENDPLIGTVVGGRFRVTGILGEGGMGRVYQGEQQMGTSVRKVAVKTLLAQFAKDPETVARFMRECGTVSELEHPNTIKVYDFGQTNTGELYIAMELLTGRSLETILETEGALNPERVDKILAQVCGSLQEAHVKGIIHRDLKPANIQLSTRAGEDDYVKVLDFGIAKRGSGSTKQEQKLTQQGKILGTPPYMSPEQFKGGELDARSDIYSLGVMTYEMLTHRLPFDADTPWAWATQHMTSRPFPFETIPMAANVPVKMRNAVMRALEKEPVNRQQSARDFYEELSIGTTRLSFIGGSAPRSPSASFPPGQSPSGGGGYATGPVPGYPTGGAPGRGQTQVGEPLFPPGGAVVPSHTMVDAPAMQPVHSGGMSGGGVHAVPTPPVGGHKKSNAGPIIGVVAVLVAGAAVAGVLMLRGGGKDEDDPTILGLDGGTTSVLSAEPITTGADAGAVALVDAGGKPVSTTGGKTSGGATSGGATSGGATSGGGTDPKADHACDAAIAAALGNNVGIAVGQFRKCDGPKRSKALAAIDAASLRKSKDGCRAKGELRQAAAIGASSGFNALPSSCK